MMLKKIINNSWFTVEEIDSTTYAISEYGHWEKVHSYLLIGTNQAVLIDTGLGISNIKTITDQLTKLPIIVITTHVHWDHIGSHGEFTTIYVHENDSKWLTYGLPLPLIQIRKDVSRDITVPLPIDFDMNNYIPYTGEPTKELKGGEIIDFGNRFLEILHTPGHSPGHIAVYEEDRGYLFTGDLLYDTTPIYAFYPSTNPIDLVRSLEYISSIHNVTKIYGGHNTLGLNASLLQEIKYAVQYLKENELIRFGTGIHEFNGFKIQF